MSTTGDAGFDFAGQMISAETVGRISDIRLNVYINYVFFSEFYVIN